MSSLTKCVRDYRLAPVYLAYLTTFGLAGGQKVMGLPNGIPEWFTKMFAPTLLGTSAFTLAASFYMITAMETLTFVGLVVSLFKMEFLPKRGRPFLLGSLLLAGISFASLGFGLRLTHDYSGAAALFAYFGATLVSILYVESASEA